MSKIKILLIGSAGMAGHVLKNEILKHSEKIELIDIARSNQYTSPTIKMDITNFVLLGEVVTSYDFDYIINAVGVLNKTAEDNPDLAILINSYLPHFLEKITRNTKTKIFHISTDCVFSGKKGSYIEKDFRDGKGFYAQTKALGELVNDKDLTIRTSIIGPDLNSEGIGLFNWFINQTGIVKGFSNAIWSGVTTIQLAKSIVEVILSNNNISGLVHLTNNKKINKFNLLILIKEVFDLKDIELQEFDSYKVDKSLLNTQKNVFNNIPTYKEMICEMYQWITINNPK
jgi:dTDP-4-dehydrorhamnose reductase